LAPFERGSCLLSAVGGQQGIIADSWLRTADCWLEADGKAIAAGIGATLTYA
jgi:hypothetical protein